MNRLSTNAPSSANNVHFRARESRNRFHGVIRRWAAGEMNATGFRAEADYALRVSLLGVATPSTRQQLLAELRACERALARPGNRAA